MLFFENAAIDFEIIGVGQSFGEIPFEDPLIDVADSLLGSSDNISITNDDIVLVKPNCLDSEIEEVAFSIEGSASGTVFYDNEEDEVIDSVDVSLSVDVNLSHA